MWNLRSISSKTALCLSNSSFENGDSDIVFFTLIFMDSHISWKPSLLNFYPMPLKKFDGGPNMDILDL